MFNAQLILATLVQTAHSTKLVTQLHRFMLCQDVAGIHQDADYCAVGKAAPIKIDHSISVVQLLGFTLLADEPMLWLQVTTALLDYVCFMSNSAIQKAYHDTQNRKTSLRSFRQPTSIQFRSSLIMRNAVTIHIAVLLQQLNEQPSIISTVVSRS